MGRHANQAGLSLLTFSTHMNLHKCNHTEMHSMGQQRCSPAPRGSHRARPGLGPLHRCTPAPGRCPERCEPGRRHAPPPAPPAAAGHG